MLIVVFAAYRRYNSIGGVAAVIKFDVSSQSVSAVYRCRHNGASVFTSYCVAATDTTQRFIDSLTPSM